MNFEKLLSIVKITSLRQRITLLFVLLVTLSEATALIVLSVAGTGIAHRQIDSDLDSAQRIFARQLDNNRDRLMQSARVLAADFGFREAIGTQDGPTLISALTNHGSRIGADLILLAGNSGELLGSVPQQADVARFPLPAALAAAQNGGTGASIVSLDGKAYQLVVVPVLAPVPIAWVAMGFALDANLARDLQKLTALDVSFLIHDTGGAWKELGSSLIPEQQTDLETWLSRRDSYQLSDNKLQMAGAAYTTRVQMLNSDQNVQVVAVLQRSVDMAMAPFKRLANVLVVLIIASLLLSIALVYVLSGHISKPLRRLTASVRRMRDGHYDQPVQFESGDELGVLVDSFNHMREGIAERETKILKLAYQDSLTDLPNRLSFQTFLRDMIEQRDAESNPLAVMVLNLNRFRMINATLDFSVGDEVLRVIALRLRAALSADAKLARLGGDEFAVIAPLGQIGGSEVLIRSLLRCFETPLVVREQALDVTASIGFAQYPADGSDADTLTRHADLACHAAKRQHADYARFDAATMSTKQAHLSLLGELRHAIEHNELRVYYQPKIACRDGALEGVEALVRWQHPQRGFVNPGDFIPFAEQTGSIRQITRWVLAAALRDCSSWMSAGLDFSVSINLSTRDLLDPDLPDYVQKQLRLHSVPPEKVCLEITESGLMENPAHSLATLERLDTLGTKLAIDDYGTGYSSLAYVKQLPVDELKIDRAFIKDIVRDRSDRAIVRSTIDMAHNLGLTVTAEGVEEQAGIDHLLDMGCDQIQGYVFSRPLPLEQLMEWIRASGRGVQVPVALSA